MSPTAHRVIAVLVAAAGIFFVIVGIRMWIRASALESRGLVTQARLTAIHERDDSDTGIVANYAFEVGGERFHHLGLFSEVPVDITPEQAASPSQTIEVRYLAEDPWVNGPASMAAGRSKQLVAIVVGLGMIVAALVRWMSARGA